MSDSERFSRIGSRTRQAVDLLRSVRSMPERAAKYLTRVTELVQATDFARGITSVVPSSKRARLDDANPLAAFARRKTTGRGIWKWDHYFAAYHRHLSKFVGRPAHLLEVGIFSGGSIEMWKEYLGPQCRITGVDIQESCRAYEEPGVTIAIGDQADRGFWQSTLARIGSLDIVIDDGGHTHEQQRVTLEETLPHLAPGGVFICEDVHGVGNPFTAYAATLVDQLNAFDRSPEDSAAGAYSSKTSAFQRLIDSVSFYPYMVVIERSDEPFEKYVAERRGSQWQPYL